MDRAQFGRLPIYAPADLFNVFPADAFMVYQLERCPTTNRRHLQGYFHFQHPKGFRSVKAYFGERWQHVHIEAARGNAASNIKYCTKEETQEGPPFTSGEAPTGQGKRTDIDDFIAELSAKRGKLDWSDPINAKHIMLHPNGVQRLINLAAPPPRPRNEPLMVVYIWGEPGTGKSRLVRSICRTESTKHCDDLYIFPILSRQIWADGYRGHPYALLEDFTSEVFGIEAFLRVTDRYTVELPIKGQFVTFAPFVLFITSNYSPDELFPLAGRQHGALLRRLNVIVELQPRYVKITKWKL